MRIYVMDFWFPGNNVNMMERSIWDDLYAIILGENLELFIIWKGEQKKKKRKKKKDICMQLHFDFHGSCGKCVQLLSGWTTFTNWAYSPQITLIMIQILLFV